MIFFALLRFLLLFSIPFTVQAEMRFRYTPHSGGILNCTHTQIRDLPDWKVVCGPNGEKTFKAHVIIREHQREVSPKTTLEILYWVTQPGETPRSVSIFHSSSFLLRFDDTSKSHSMILSQGVDNDYATLDLLWRRPATAKPRPSSPPEAWCFATKR